MKILVTGAKGQLGSDLVKELQKRNIEAVGVDLQEMDIRSESSCQEVIETEQARAPLEAVIHCAAYTAVDKAEDEPELVREVNSRGTENIAKVCRDLNIKMLYISTDYVFDGEGSRPWEPDDPRNPLNVYGQTKYEGELAVEKYLKKYFIIRISWVFGLRGSNFIKTMLKLAKDRKELKVVNDQTGSPTYTPDLAVLLADMAVTNKYGRYHATNEGLCTWYEFALEIFKQAGVKEIKVIPVASGEFPVKAKRPHNSRMDKSKLDEKGFKRLPVWQEALERYLKELKELNQN